MITAYLNTNDVENTLKFFIETLGFEAGFSMPGEDGKTSFGIVKQGEATSFMVGQAEAGTLDGKELGCGIQFWVYPEDKAFDLDGYYSIVKGKGAKIEEELNDGYWGDRYFSVSDPNGYRLVFAKTVEEVPNEEVLERAATSRN